MDAIQESLDLYAMQLSQVQAALGAEPANEDLVKLEADLQQLIELTTQNLLEEKKKALLAQLPLESSDESETANVSQELESDMSNLVGMKCKAPHSSRSHGESYHNAIIFHVESNCADFEGVLVRVVFSHPTSQDMVPCPFYLEGKCRFTDENCRFSHGEVVKLSALAEFKEPKYENLKEKSQVLARKDGEKLWKHAHVETVEDGFAFVRFTQDHKNIEKLELKDVFPLVKDDDTEEDESLDDPEESDFVPVEMLVGNLSTSSSLGDWEIHTRGVASKLMAKMGYVVGSGLGKRADGRVEPVPAMVYPTGKSLDWCMEAREKAGGGDMLSVEKKMKRQQAREAKKEERRMENEQKNMSVFDFINNKLGNKKGDLKELKRDSGKQGGSGISLKKGGGEKKGDNLNVQAFKLTEEIQSVEREIQRYKTAYDRNKGRDQVTANMVLAKMKVKKAQLEKLRETERGLNKSKRKEENKKKLEIF